LLTETLAKCLPTIGNIEDGLKVYYKYYSKEDEEKYKIRAFKFE
jgi:ASC-1-like (ASCH) protein